MRRIVAGCALLVMLASCQGSTVQYDKEYDKIAEPSSSLLGEEAPEKGNSQEDSETETAGQADETTDQEFPEEYAEVMGLDEIWDNPGLDYRCLGGHNGIIYFYAETATDYELYGIHAAGCELLYRATIPYFEAELSFQQGVLFLKTRTEVTALDSTLTEIYHEPVPEVVQVMLENATLSPDNYAGFHLPDMYLAYDISANYVYAFADDYGMYLYYTKPGELVKYIAFAEPEEFVGGPYYPDHFWRPQYSHDGRMLTAQGISLPRAGGSSSIIFGVYLENGRVENLLSSTYHEELFETTYYPLEHIGNITEEYGLYVRDYFGSDQKRYFLGPLFEWERFLQND